MTDAERKAKIKYRKKGKRVLLDFYPSEQEMIDWLEQQEKIATYIKELIRKDMGK